MATSWLSGFLSTPLGSRLSFYPTVLWGIVVETLGWRHRYNRIDATVLLGGIPFGAVAKELVLKENVKGVVILNEEYETRYISLTEKDWECFGVKSLRIPTTDFDNAPPLDQLETGVEFIESFTTKEQSVYVHCKAGRGRSALLVLCYMMQTYHLSPMCALDYIKERRPYVLLGKRQWRRALEYHQHITE